MLRVRRIERGERGSERGRLLAAAVERRGRQPLLEAQRVRVRVRARVRVRVRLTVRVQAEVKVKVKVKVHEGEDEGEGDLLEARESAQRVVGYALGQLR